jgi:hypothetical protein
LKKFILSTLVTVFCLASSLSFQNLYSIKPLNSAEVKNTISYLSSDSFNGRLAGTLENYATAYFIKDYFKSQSIKPYDKKYFESFSVLYPKKIDGSPMLSIQDKNGFIIKKYKYGIDYKEDMLNFRNNNVSFDKNNIVSWKGNSFQVQDGSDYFLFYNPRNDNLNFRSSFMANSTQSMYIMIKKSVSKEIKDYLNLGYKVNCFIPFKSQFTSIYNVIGYIKGKNPSLPPLILSAHFDHLGSDVSGTTYSGALDNASGTSFLLSLVKYINSLGSPERNIIIASFNAEELGCLGSKSFVKKYKQNLKGSKVINFDMIGSDRNVPISIIGGKWDSKNSSLVKEVANICTKENQNFSYIFENSSDHGYFRAYGIDAITLSDEDTSRIHTPSDKINHISEKSIDRCFDIVSREINSFAFNNNPFLIYYKQIFIASICSLLIISLIYLKSSKF